MKNAANSMIILSGLLFGLGLSVSGMTDPNNVFGFLDITGDWNPALMFVLGGAVATNMAGTQWVLRQQKPKFGTTFHLPASKTIDASLIYGAICFGIGWGLTGYCPGASLAALSDHFSYQALVFVMAMLVGMWLANQARTRVKK